MNNEHFLKCCTWNKYSNIVFCLQELRLISVDESFLFHLLKLPLFMTLLILIFSPHNILGNLPHFIWHQKDMVLPSRHAGETNQFLFPDRVMKVLCSAFYCHGNRKWDFPMELDWYTHREKQFLKSSIPFL